MADKNISALPQIPQLSDDALMVVEQQGTAMKMTGEQFKEFGKQGVIQDMQGYVNAAQQAAEDAEDAVDSVLNMTVDAQTLSSGQNASVTKSMKNGVVNLNFGLPRGIPGPKGETGADGQTGPPGPKGETGKGIQILGYYDTLSDLQAAVTSPEPGDPYSVGTAPPYHLYIYDGVTGTWKDNGEFTSLEMVGIPEGGTTGQALLKRSDDDYDTEWKDIPSAEDAVTAPGGASIVVTGIPGDGPHILEITDEEETPPSAQDIAYENQSMGSDIATVEDALNKLFTSVSDGKQAVASAITDKGVPTAQDATFQQMADNIGQISGGTSTADATATPGDILSPKTAYTASGKVTGVIPSLPAQTITPGTADQTIANGQYLSGTQTIQGDSNLVSANIRQGISIFGVDGAMTSEFKATLTVTVDVGAVVTATCGATEVSALCTTGAVTLELPMEGTWTVTAVRGVAQYNSVVITVSSSYSASLTAEVHIEYVGAVTGLDKARRDLAAASIGSYVLFCGGYDPNGDGTLDTVDAYNSSLTHSSPTILSVARYQLAAATVDGYALFAGGYMRQSSCSVVDAYNASLTRTTPEELSEARYRIASATIGNYALFGGGDSSSATVDAYDENLTRTTRTPLLTPRNQLAASANENYALFGGGYTYSGGNQDSNRVDAYSTSLTRSTPTALGIARYSLSACRAGNYVLFAGGVSGIPSKTSSFVDAYDLFLTRTTPSELSVARNEMAATTLMNHALFGGGSPSSMYISDAVDVYDPLLVKTSPGNLAESRSKLAAASVGNFALFGGGEFNSFLAKQDVEAYQYV